MEAFNENITAIRLKTPKLYHVTAITQLLFGYNHYLIQLYGQQNESSLLHTLLKGFNSKFQE